MEKKHRCRLCFRNFANGRALGGHMRSHVMKLYAEEKPPVSKQENGEFDHDFQSSSSASQLPSSSSSEYEEEEEEERDAARGLSSYYALRENPKKSAVLVDHRFSSAVVQDRESETDTEVEKMKKKPTCRRSKRVRKSRISDLNVFVAVKKAKLEDFEGKEEQSSPLSSISDTTPEEHLAHCLIMLSRDKWEKEEEEEEREFQEEEEDEDEEEELNELNIDISQDSGLAKINKFRGKYRCEACNKLFRSYQALGGHRASHKKFKLSTAAPRRAAAVVVEAKIHQCPFCDRVFPSGQALGGHKRSHFTGGGAISSNGSSNSTVKQDSIVSKVFNIDLNLPAPADDEEIVISVVSNAEFVHSFKQ